MSDVDRSRAFMPPGTLPPFVLRFNAGSVPIGNLVFEHHPHRRRTSGRSAEPSARCSRPCRGCRRRSARRSRTIVINADPEKLRSYNMSPEELVRALSTTTPSALGKRAIGNYWPMVPSDTVVANIKVVGRSIATRRRSYIREVASLSMASDGARRSAGATDASGPRVVPLSGPGALQIDLLAALGLMEQAKLGGAAAAGPAVRPR